MGGTIKVNACSCYKTKRRDGNCLRNKSRDFFTKRRNLGQGREGGDRDYKDVILLTKSKHRQAGGGGGTRYRSERRLSVCVSAASMR